MMLSWLIKWTSPCDPAQAQFNFLSCSSSDTRDYHQSPSSGRRIITRPVAIPQSLLRNSIPLLFAPQYHHQTPSSGHLIIIRSAAIPQSLLRKFDSTSFFLLNTITNLHPVATFSSDRSPCHRASCAILFHCCACAPNLTTTRSEGRARQCMRPSLVYNRAYFHREYFTAVVIGVSDRMGMKDHLPPPTPTCPRPFQSFPRKTYLPCPLLLLSLQSCSPGEKSIHVRRPSKWTTSTLTKNERRISSLMYIIEMYSHIVLIEVKDLP